MANVLNTWIDDNSVTADPKDKILVLQSPGKADMDKVYEEMIAQDTGLRRETIVHVTTLFERTCAQLLMNGWQLNTDLFQAVARLSGIVTGGQWDPKKNSVYISFTQDKFLREEMAKTTVKILGLKADVMSIIEVEDVKTGARDGSITPGRNIWVRGSYLRVAGANEAVGVTLRNTSTNAVVKLDADMISRNNPSELGLLMPADLADGMYELTVTTQYTSGTQLLKEPRSTSTMVTVGVPPSGGGNEGGDDVLE